MSVQELNGADPTATTVTTIRFCTTDAYAPALTYPIPIPTSGFNYSYWKTINLAITNIGTKINNVRFYCDGTIGFAYGSGGLLRIGIKSTGDNGLPVASYLIASGTPGTTGPDMDDSSTGHTYYKSGSSNHAAPANIQSYHDVASALIVDTTDHITNESTKCVVMQVKLDTAANGAAQGAQSAETLTWLYDEI